ncbi:rubrerythrin [Leptospira ilyithenensis]|uniref:Rubrerythrin n=1 Tax=Leptospira ilyithenensis TaxID=2484901 RepID=A0A4R9LL42_9LEPT|nr:rubrerythrin [Leptospira ilyithenensis]TGN06955.1 rubrerythrin [Leptospira ilyithenensis]
MISLAKPLEEQKLKSFFQELITQTDKHSLWLNTLSLLEHIGSRKILMTQSSEETSEMILRHATEEARHALFFKKAARSIKSDFDSGYRSTELLQGGSAKIYFAKLDASVRKNLKYAGFSGQTFTYLAYLYTTTVIEERAMIVYRIYNSVLEEASHSLNLNNLIMEEEGHLDEMSNELAKLDKDYQTRLTNMLDQEQKIFNRFFKALTLQAA